MERLISLVGLFIFIGIAYLLSARRSAIRWTTLGWGIALQLMLAIFIVKIPFGFTIFEQLGEAIKVFLSFSDVGAAFVFGENFWEHFIAFQVLPTVIFFSAFVALLYYYNILPQIVKVLGWIMMRLMKTSGAESLSCAANIFVGQTEAPLVIKPYVNSLTLSELHAVMTGGFATIAGGVMAAYIAMGISPVHLITASVMSAPAALAISKVMYPETEKPETTGKIQVNCEKQYVNGIDAITTGALDGVKLVLNIAAMLIAFLGLVALVNALLGFIGQGIGVADLSLEGILSYLMFPLAWLMGIPWEDCAKVGVLLGEKTILNEFIAYSHLQQLMAENALSQRSEIIAIYALCGFANLGSVGIQIGGISAIAPHRQGDLARLGIRTLIAGTLACFMTACLVGILL